MQSYRLSIIGFFFFWTLSHNAQIPEYYSAINFKENNERISIALPYPGLFGVLTGFVLKR